MAVDVFARGSHPIGCCRDNLVTACEMCNSQKGNSSLKQMGWKLKQIPKVSQAVRWQQLGDAAPHSPGTQGATVQGTVAYSTGYLHQPGPLESCFC